MEVSNTPATPQSTVQPVTAPSTSLITQPPSSASPWLWVVLTIAILLILFLMMVAGWQIFDLRSDLARASHTLQLVSSQQQLQWQDWNQAHPQIKSQLQQLSNEQLKQLQHLSQLQQQLDAWRLRWEQELSKDPLKRQINELQDLLDHAHRHLLLTASAQQTQVLLDQAYALCTRFQSTLLQPVCLLIAQDKQALSQFTSPDTNKVLEQLSQLESQLLLPLQQAQQLQFNPAISNNPAPEKPTDNWHQYLLHKVHYFWQQLGGFIRDHLVKVHHLYESGNDRYQLNLPELDQLSARLTLLFQQARTALLIQNQQIFQSTLAEIQHIAKAHANLLPNQTLLLAEIEQLKTQSILQTPPLTLKANEMLSRLLKSFGGSGNNTTKDSDSNHSAKPVAAPSPSVSL
jgi:uncharacterized protein HemX